MEAKPAATANDLLTKIGMLHQCMEKAGAPTNPDQQAVQDLVKQISEMATSGVQLPMPQQQPSQLPSEEESAVDVDLEGDIDDETLLKELREVCRSHPRLWTSHYAFGLAQLERQTTVKGHTKLEIRLGLAHLDDLLSSLFLATDGDVTVKGIRYPSVHNLGQARSASSFASMMADDEESLELPGSVEGYARALVGTPVSVKRHTGDALAGTLLACTPGSGIPANGAEPGEAAGASPRPSSLVLVAT